MIPGPPQAACRNDAERVKRQCHSAGQHRPEFPANRENSREFCEFERRSVGVGVVFRRRLNALRAVPVSCRTGNFLTRTGNSFVTVVVPGWCKSAGTLLCIGAYDLVMGDLGELGPLDVQVAKRDELALVSSGLTIDSAFRGLQSVAFQMFETFLLDTVGKSHGRITTKTAAELSASMTVGLLAPVFQQLDPMKIGDDFRSTRIAQDYALRLDGRSQNMVHDDDMDAIEALTRGYPSHGFVIDRTEAESLFHRVSPLVLLRHKPLRPCVCSMWSAAGWAAR